MVTTTSIDNDPLPEEVEDLIDRRLRLMRSQEDMRLTGIKAEMGRAVANHVHAWLDSYKSRDAIRLGTLAAYRDAAAKLLQVTDKWPDAVWKTIEPILDYVSITRNHRGSIARLLYTHAWSTDEVPWTAGWLDGDGFAGLVQQVMGGYGLATAGSSPDFERQLSLESSNVKAGFANHGRIALGKAEHALDEYLLARRGDAAAAPAIPEVDSAAWLDAIARKTASANHVEADGTRIEARQTTTKNEPTYIPYPKAMKILRESLGATPAELAVWVSFGDTPGGGGIIAFLEAGTTDNPQTLRFDCWSEADFDYLGPLMGAWFVLEDIMSFQPINRYVEYRALVERWQRAENILDVYSYISAKVREDRLHELHPATGHSQLSRTDDENLWPTRETTLLDLADVEAIEREEDIEVCVEEKPASEEVVDRERHPLGVNRRERRKQGTEAMYQTWQDEYQRLRSSNPEKSKRWCAKRIARMDIAFGRDEETIRRRLR